LSLIGWVKRLATGVSASCETACADKQAGASAARAVAAKAKDAIRRTFWERRTNLGSMAILFGSEDNGNTGEGAG
jgi:hypothetical protein